MIDREVGISILHTDLCVNQISSSWPLAGNTVVYMVHMSKSVKMPNWTYSTIQL